MTLPASGQITYSAINVENNHSSTSQAAISVMTAEVCTTLTTIVNEPDNISDWYSYTQNFALSGNCSGLVLTWDDFSESMDLDWTNACTNETGVRIEHNLNGGGFSFLTNGPVNDIHYTHYPACDPADTKAYRVRGYNSCNSGSWTTDEWEGLDCSGCLTGDANIYISPSVIKNIKDIKKGDLVYTAHHRKLTELAYYEVKKIKKATVKDIVNVRFKDGTSIKCSTSHKFMTAIKQDEKGDGISIRELKVGDYVLKVIDDEWSSQIIKDISFHKEEIDIYHVTVACAKTYITDDGLIHHNEK